MGLFNRVRNLLKAEEEMKRAKFPGRNEHCWCGSGRKYKKCHQSMDQEKMTKACMVNCGPA